MDIVERFKKYVSIESTSNASSETVPSTKEQLNFAKILVEDMKEIGIEGARLDKNGYVYGYLNSNTEKKCPMLAL